VEVTRFHGFGNETSSLSDGDDEPFEVRQRELRVRSLATWSPLEGLELGAGAEFSALRPEANVGTVLRELSPYGYSDFEQLSMVATLVLDRRDDPLTPRHGAYLELEGRWSPESLDVAYAYGGLRGQATAYLSRDEGPLRPSLALRIGGETVQGTYPYFEAAKLGGRESVRGFRNGRFAGDSSVWGNAEMRVFLTHFLFILPGDLGALALADVGRVFYEGEESDRWHSAIGGGLWVDWVDTYLANLAVARSAEATSVYFGLGFSF
jgi:outer membrane protein assembly factor BamA